MEEQMNSGFRQIAKNCGANRLESNESATESTQIKLKKTHACQQNNHKSMLSGKKHVFRVQQELTKKEFNGMLILKSITKNITAAYNCICNWSHNYPR